MKSQITQSDLLRNKLARLGRKIHLLLFTTRCRRVAIGKEPFDARTLTNLLQEANTAIFIQIIQNKKSEEDNVT